MTNWIQLVKYYIYNLLLHPQSSYIRVLLQEFAVARTAALDGDIGDVGLVGHGMGAAQRSELWLRCVRHSATKKNDIYKYHYISYHIISYHVMLYLVMLYHINT